MGWTGAWTSPPATEQPSQVLVVPRDLVSVGLKDLDRRSGILSLVGDGPRGFYPWYLFIVQFDAKKKPIATECGFFETLEEEAGIDRPFRIGFCFDLKDREKKQPPSKIYLELDKNDDKHLLISISTLGEDGFRYDEDHR